MKLKILVASICAGAALTASATTMADEFDPTAEIYALERMALKAPPAGQSSPVIDGAIKAGEWDRSAAITGFYDYTSGLVRTAGPVSFVNYDKANLNFLVLVPRTKDRDLIAREKARDGDVYKDDSVEIYFAPEGHMYQFVVNPLGTLADYKDNNIQWNSAAAVKSGQVAGRDLPPSWGLNDEEFWLVEASIPAAELGTGLTPGTAVPFNVAVNDSGRPASVLSPVKGGAFADKANFIDLKLLAANEPYVQLTSLGQLRFGDIRLRGRVVNPSAAAVQVTTDIDVRRKGSYLTKDAYRNVVGAIQLQRQPIAVPAGGSSDLDVKLTAASIEYDQFGVRVAVDKAEAIMARHGVVKIEPPLLVKLGNVQPRKYFVLDIDARGLKNMVTSGELPLAIDVFDKDGKNVYKDRRKVLVDTSEVQISYAKLPVGSYICRVAALSPKGESLVSKDLTFRHILPPKWLTSTVYDDYGKMDRVPKPWVPVTTSGKSVSIWGRTVTWGESLLPASIKATGVELLQQPMKVVLKIGGREYTVPLQSLRVTERKKSRVSLVAEGQVQGITAVADMWMEFDGFLWVTLRLKDSQDKRKIDGLHIVTALKPEQSTLYQTFARNHAGYIGNDPIKLAWLSVPAENIVNFYHWMGNEDRGLGFTYRTLQHWAAASDENFCTITRTQRQTQYSINLIEKPVTLNGRSFQFGIQATPIKPLRPDYGSMLAASAPFAEPWRAWRQVPENIDMSLAWPEPNGTGMKGLQDPYHLNDQAMKQLAEDSHGLGVAFMGVASCPQKVTPQDENFEDYKLDWIVLPESVLNWEGIPHYQNAGDSYSLRKWLFYGWTENVKKYKMDGVYFDGWQAGQIASNNPHNGAGWVDENGKRQCTIPVLEGREFNMRMVLFLEDNVKGRWPSSAPELDNFPKYHYWIHSWEFVPSIMGFATDWLTGEFAGWPVKGPSMLTPEGSYGKTVGMGLFRSRALSTNWGIPNYFDGLMWENTQESPDRQTLMAYAWFLPHGVPIGIIEYMNAKTVTEMTKIQTKFGARRANFTPGWRPNPFLKVLSPIEKEVMAATWDHGKANKVMAVVSNLQIEKAQDIALQWTGFTNPKIKNARTGEVLDLKEGKLTVRLEPESFILLDIQ